MTKKSYPKRKYGSDRRSFTKVEHTCNDQRCNPITLINIEKPKCPAGTIIVAKKGAEKNTINMCCGCNIIYETSTIFEYNLYEAVAAFVDSH